VESLVKAVFRANDKCEVERKCRRMSRKAKVLVGKNFIHFPFASFYFSYLIAAEVL
jgi:hypothetical protein